jgi:hypothetical protein
MAMKQIKDQSTKLTTYLQTFFGHYKIYLGSLALIAIAAGLFEVEVNYKIKEIIDNIAAKDINRAFWPQPSPIFTAKLWVIRCNGLILIYRRKSPIKLPIFKAI